MFAETQKYPLDFAALKKGDVISQEKLVEIIGLEPTDPRYRIEVLKLRHHIEFTLATQNYWVTIKEDSGNLCILTDGESAVYNDKQFKNNINRALRSYDRLLRVDNNNLTMSEQKRHFRNLETNGKVIQAISSTTKSVKLESSRRNTPGLAGR